MSPAALPETGNETRASSGIVAFLAGFILGSRASLGFLGACAPIGGLEW